MAPKRVDKTEKRLQLVEAAARVFRDQGFQATTMEAIAERAGVSKGALYNYFPSKEELFFAVFEWFGGRALASAGAGAEPNAPPRQQLVALVCGAARFLARERAYMGLSMEFWAAAGSRPTAERFTDALQELYRHSRTLAAGLIRDGQRSGDFAGGVDADALAAALTGALDGLAIQLWLEPLLDIEAVARTLVTTVVDGLAQRLPTGGGSER